MASYGRPTRSRGNNSSLIDERDPPKVRIHHTKVINDDRRAAALFAAIEVLTWQLVTLGVLPAEPLADELTRHAHFHSGGERLQLLARVARAAAPSRRGP